MNSFGYKIGARNINAVVMIPVACFRSRRNTPSEANSQMVPATKGKKHATTTGNSKTVQGIDPFTHTEIISRTMVDTIK